MSDTVKKCYQRCEENTPGAVKVDDLGFFAPASYDETYSETLKDACKAWTLRIYHAEGIDQDHDSGIYDVDRTESDESFTPSCCILDDGKVLGFIDERNLYYVIGGTIKWLFDYGHADIVDRTTYLLMKK